MENKHFEKVVDKFGALLGYKALDKTGELVLRQSSFRADIANAEKYGTMDDICQAEENHANYLQFLAQVL